jgi:drug/metabolite transporter (DMT)-like permease
MEATKRAYFELHFAVILWSFTAILGQLIHLSALSLVWWRVFIASGAILIGSQTWAAVRQMPRSLVLQYIGIGCIIMVHWLTFFGAVKLSNASITLICMATTSFFAALLEPLIFRQKVKLYEVAIGIIIIPAMAFVAGTLPDSMSLGILVGLLSAFLQALFSTLNKRLVHHAPPLSISFLELGGGCLFLSILLPIYFQIDTEAQFLPPSVSDWIYLLILALLCTNLAFILGMRVLRHISAFAANLTINLEPVYGILLAILILKENKDLTPSFYFGALVIMLAIFSYPFLRTRFEKK